MKTKRQLYRNYDSIRIIHILSLNISYFNFSNIIKKSAATFLIFFWFYNFSIGQNASPQKPKYHFQHLDISLNSNSIETILQDSYGYAWIGTLGGLHKYDGMEVYTYLNSENSYSVNGNRQVCLFEDSKRRLWIGTENGICLYNRDEDNFINIKTERNKIDNSTRTHSMVNDITEDKNGRIWIASRDGGLQYLDEETQTFVNYFRSIDNLISFRNPASLFNNNDSILWVGTAENGIFRLNTLTRDFLNINHDPLNDNSLAGKYAEDILIDRKNNLWVATKEYGLDRIQFEGDNYQITHFKHQLGDENTLVNDDVTTVYMDHNGKIWVCNENGGLHLYNEEEDNFFRYLPDPYDKFSISNVSVKTIYHDKQGRYWVGSNLEGIDIIDNYQFQFEHYYQSAGLSGINNNIIRSIREDKNGNLWISTDGGGLNYFDRKVDEFNAYMNDPYDPGSLNSNAVLSLVDDPDGNMWVGTWRGGINVFNKNTKTFSQIDPGNELLANVFYLEKDNNNNIWVGTQSGGVSIYDWKEKQFYNYINNPYDESSLANNDVRVIFQDSKFRVWVGTEFGGLNLVEKNDLENIAFKRFKTDPKDSLCIRSNMINDIFEDKQQRIWVATEGGLSMLNEDEASFKTYKIEDGLSSNHVESIIEDDHGNLWIGTAIGISRFDPKTQAFRNYTENDGLQNGAFTRNSAFKTSKGELIFGGTNGFNIFHPDSIKDNPFLPEVYITELRIFNQQVPIGDENSILPKHISQMNSLTLSYEESVITFDFVGINFTLPKMNQYAFKLEPFETQWNYVGNQRSATYTNLDPGEYTFYVKAANNDGKWNEEPRKLLITITPPFWQEAWFKISGFLVLSVAIYMIVTFRINQLNKLNTSLEEKVNERTSQLNKLVDELKHKQKEIETTNIKLKLTHKKLETINSQLDKRVQERTTKLVKANQQLDRFVYSASHDLSAPLKSILGLINITKLENNDLNINDHLEHMEKSVMKLEDVITSLTQFSRNMGSDVQKVNFAFHDIIDEVLEDLTFLIKEKNIQIVKNYEKGDIMKSDFLRIKIILTNLISNAIKYIDKYKNEHIIKISFTKSKDSNIITIEDNGMGIKKEYQKKIYDMFFRVSTDSEGSGLGLFIVKETTEKLKGHIDLKSELGMYTNFTVSLPN